MFTALVCARAQVNNTTHMHACKLLLTNTQVLLTLCAALFASALIYIYAAIDGDRETHICSLRKQRLATPHICVPLYAYERRVYIV